MNRGSVDYGRLASITGESRQIIAESFSVIEAPKKIIDAVKKGKIGQKETARLQQLAPEKQQEVMTEFKEEWKTLASILLVLVVVQAIFWKFVKWNF